MASWNDRLVADGEDLRERARNFLDAPHRLVSSHQSWKANSQRHIVGDSRGRCGDEGVFPDPRKTATKSARRMCAIVLVFGFWFLLSRLLHTIVGKVYSRLNCGMTRPKPAYAKYKLKSR